MMDHFLLDLPGNSSQFNASFLNLSEEWENQTVQDTSWTRLPAFKVYWALVMIPLPLVAVVGNILVILSVYKERGLQSATNYFIVSLAFADLLVAAVVMPFGIYVLVNVDWELSETLCDFYIALDVTCSTASIFNLVAISVDRFIAVTQPIKYSKHKNHRRVFVTIVFVWLVSAAIGSPIVLGLNTSPERIPNLCVFYNSDFIIYSSLSSFYIPCIVMVYLYYKIFKAIHERTKKAMRFSAPVRMDHVGDVNTIENVAKVNHEEVSSSKTLTQSANCTSKLIKDVDQKRHSKTAEDEDSDGQAKSEDDGLTETDMDRVCIKSRSESNSRVIEKKSRFRFPKHHKHSKKKKEKNAARRERKATKTLAIVLGVFLICWVPFFTCNILDAICIKLQSDRCRPGVTAFLLTTWLGYINSCINPVIYTLFNIEFRKAFKKLLLEPCKEY